MRKLLPLLLLVVAVAAVAGDQAEVRVIQLRHRSARDGVVLAEGLLSEDGSVLLQPRQNTLTVRDRAEVVRRIADALAAWDVATSPYRVRVRLLLASTAPPPAGQPAPQLTGFGAELTGMFRWGGFEEVDSLEVQVQDGTAMEIKASRGYTLRFALRAVPTDTQRVQLTPFEVVRIEGQEQGVGFKHRLLRTTVSLQLGQTGILVTAQSEAAKQALVVIVGASRETQR